MRKLWAVVGVVAFAVALGAAPAGAKAHKPAGVDQAVWDSYCVNGSHIVGTLKAISKGTLTTGEAVKRLGSNESDLEDDASAMGTENKRAAAKVQGVADALGRIKVAISAGTAADFQELLTAINRLPSCS